MKININDYVRIRLTPSGINMLFEKHNRLAEKFPGGIPFHMPEIDKDGFTKYQLWQLMHLFGDRISMGGDLPFETEIEIPDAQTD